MSDQREPIIDALLEEVLGDQQPPDLTQRILGAHDAATDSSIDVGRLRPSPSGNGSSKSRQPTDHTTPRIDTDAPRKVTPGTAAKNSNWQTWASVAVVLIGLGGFFYWMNVTGKQHREGLQSPSITKIQPPKVGGTDIANIPRNEDPTANQEPYTPPGSSDEPTVQPNQTEIADGSSSAAPGDDEQLAIEDPGQKTSPEVDRFASPVFQRELQLGESQSDARMIATIDDQLEKKWEQVSLKPQPVIDDRRWFYRATKFLLGRPPSNGAVRSFARSLDREAAVDKMLQSAEFGQRWGKFLTHVLTGSTAASNSNPVDDRELAKYLADSINNGKPYDQLAFELITAAGANKPSESDFNPATNFLLANQQYEWLPGKKKSEWYRLQATEKVSQVFLGRQLQCARCHDHEGTTQDQYYQMISFFTQLRPINGRPGEASKLMNRDYAGASGRNLDEADVFFTRKEIGGGEADGTGASVYPQFLDGREVSTKSGRLSDINRREELAKFVVSSEDFPRAFVNRIWDEALGYGFTNPIEDMGSHNPPTHPELLQSLADQFTNSGFDIKPTMKWIVLSQAFNRRSRVNTDSLVRRPDLFSSFARTDANLLYQTVTGAMKESARALQAGVVPDAHAQIGMEEKQKMSAAQRSQLQASLNAKKELLKKRYGSLIAALARNEELTDLDLVKHIFLVTVGRLPVQYERDRGIEILKAKKNPESALQEIGVLLLNSKEFATQH